MFFILSQLKTRNSSCKKVYLCRSKFGESNRACSARQTEMILWQSLQLLIDEGFLPGIKSRVVFCLLRNELYLLFRCSWNKLSKTQLFQYLITFAAWRFLRKKQSLVLYSCWAYCWAIIYALSIVVFHYPLRLPRKTIPLHRVSIIILKYTKKTKLYAKPNLQQLLMFILSTNIYLLPVNHLDLSSLFGNRPGIASVQSFRL